MFDSQSIIVYLLCDQNPQTKKAPSYLINVLRVKSDGILFENPLPNILLKTQPICRCHMSQYAC